MANEVIVDPVSGVQGAQDGTRLGTGMDFEKYERCFHCGKSYQRKQMRRFRGKWYGLPCGDHRDIQDILRREKGADSRSSQRILRRLER